MKNIIKEKKKKMHFFKEIESFFFNLKSYDYISQNSSIEFVKARAEARRTGGIFRRVISFFFQMYLSRKMVNSCPDEVDVVFIVSTKNQYDAIRLIDERLRSNNVNSNVLSISHLVSDCRQLPCLYSFLLAVPFLPVACLFYLTQLNDEGERLRLVYSFDQLILAFGHRILIPKWLEKIKPKMVILSNDHNMENRVVLDFCKRLKIKTAYVQHAAVSSEFPPLSQFDVAYLDGVYSRDIYNNKGSLSSEVYLTGISKLDEQKIKVNSVNVYKPDSISRIGIAINTLYKEELFITVVDVLLGLGKKVVIRPHPGQKRNVSELIDLLGSRNVSYSLPWEEDVGTFLLSLDMVVAGNSSILLEGCILKRKAVYVNIDNLEHDYYGFVKMGVVYNVDVNSSTLRRDFNNIFNDTESKHSFSKYYDASVGESFYGYSCYKVAELVMNEVGLS